MNIGKCLCLWPQPLIKTQHRVAAFSPLLRATVSEGIGTLSFMTIKTFPRKLKKTTLHRQNNVAGLKAPNTVLCLKRLCLK